MMPRLVSILILLALCSAGLPSAVRGEDQDRARQAVEQGEIRPLDQVLRAVRDKVPGDVVDVELDHDDGRWIYEIKVLTPSGKRREVEIDATSLTILEID